MVATWPLTSRMKPDADQYIEARQPNRITFDPEVGPTIDRRRGTAAGTLVTIRFTGLTDAERATFEDWYEGPLYDGALPFSWVDPIRGVSASYKFTKDAYQLSAHDHKFDLSFQLLRFP